MGNRFLERKKWPKRCGEKKEVVRGSGRGEEEKGKEGGEKVFNEFAFDSNFFIRTS